jgi:hypothetical protein
VDGVVTDVDPLVGTHLQSLLEGIGGALRTDGEDGDLTLVRFGEPQRLLDGILVDLREQTVDVGAVRRVVLGVEGAVRLGVRDVLDADDDVHPCSSFSWGMVGVHPFTDGSSPYAVRA